MNTLNRTANRSCLQLIARLSLVIGLTACGGGGGGGGGITLPTAPVTITQQNAPQIAGVAIDTLYGGTSLPIATGVQTSATASARSSTSVAQTVARIGQAAAQQIISQRTETAIVTGAVSTTTCPGGGTMSVSGSGASGSVTYTNCKDLGGVVTINGTVSISNANQIGSIISADAVFNLTVSTVTPANTLTAMGDMHFEIDTVTLAMTISGNSLAMGNTNPAMGNFGLQNYMISIDTSGNFSVLSFRFSSTAINGTAVFAMTTPFAYGAGMFPSSGVATITGANSTVLRITILGDESSGGSQVQLELIIDGGNNWAAPTYHSWASISSLI